MTPLTEKAIIIIVLISVALIFGYDVINVEGMFGNEEQHIITVEWKKHEFYWDSGCWNYFFADEKGNVYNIPKELYAKIQPGHTYYIKTGKRSFLNWRWHVNYVEERPNGGPQANIAIQNHPKAFPFPAFSITAEGYVEENTDSGSSGPAAVVFGGIRPG